MVKLWDAKSELTPLINKRKPLNSSVSAKNPVSIRHLNGHVRNNV